VRAAAVARCRVLRRRPGRAGAAAAGRCALRAAAARGARAQRRRARTLIPSAWLTLQRKPWLRREKNFRVTRRSAPRKIRYARAPCLHAGAR
jgi:hypothetical protein